MKEAELIGITYTKVLVGDYLNCHRINHETLPVSNSSEFILTDTVKTSQQKVRKYTRVDEQDYQHDYYFILSPELEEILHVEEGYVRKLEEAIDENTLYINSLKKASIWKRIKWIFTGVDYK